MKDIKVDEKTHDRLSNYGRKNETFNQIINRLLDEVKSGIDKNRTD